MHRVNFHLLTSILVLQSARIWEGSRTPKFSSEFGNKIDSTMANPSVVYTVGEEVAVVKGIYKRYKTAIYKGDYGDKMCSVTFGSGAASFTRNIRKTSIAKKATPNAATST